MMQGYSDDISAIQFFSAQIIKEKRNLWDKVIYFTPSIEFYFDNFLLILRQ